MADYFTQFSCMFDVGTAENAARAEEIRRRQADALDDAEGADLGFEMEHDPDCGPGALWISSDGYGEPEHVIAFVLACAEAFDLTGRWGSPGRSPAPSPASTVTAAARRRSTSARARAWPGPTARTGSARCSIRPPTPPPADPQNLSNQP